MSIRNVRVFNALVVKRQLAIEVVPGLRSYRKVPRRRGRWLRVNIPCHGQRTACSSRDATGRLQTHSGPDRLSRQSPSSRTRDSRWIHLSTSKRDSFSIGITVIALTKHLDWWFFLTQFDGHWISSDSELLSRKKSSKVKSHFIAGKFRC